MFTVIHTTAAVKRIAEEKRVSTQSTGTVGKALDMLSLLGEHPDGATAHELADASGHHFSTAYRLLRTLVATGFAEHSPQDKRYRLGLPVFQLGQKVAHARGFDASAAPVLYSANRPSVSRAPSGCSTPACSPTRAGSSA